jgi:hypothetical protein
VKLLLGIRRIDFDAVVLDRALCVRQGWKILDRSN